MELPSTWTLTDIGEVAEVSGGIQKQQKRRPIKNAYPFLRVANVGRGSLDLSEVHEIELFEGELERYRLAAGDLLVVEGNGSPDQIGRAATWRGTIRDTVHQNHLIRVRPTSAISARFLELVWNAPAVSGQLKEVAQSTSGLYTLSTSKVKRVRVPLPPLAEQHRIVEALDDHLSRLDAAERLALSAQKRFRSLTTSVVQTALDTCSSYPTETLGDLLREPLRNGHSARATTDSDGIRTLSLTAVTLGDFSDKNTKVTEADSARVADLWLEPGDILVQRSNTPELVGTSALYNGPRNWAIYPDLLIRVRTAPRLTPEFAALVLRSMRARSYFKGRAKGLAGTMPKIDQATISSLEIPVPPVGVQKLIVADVHERLDQAAHVKDELARLTHRASSLRRALLRCAFTGRLAPQDPADEPASVLLDHIRAERDAQGGKAKRGARRPRKSAEVTPPPTPASTPSPTTAVQQELPL